MPYVLGVDPGKSGGLALLHPSGTVPVSHTKMPERDGDLAIWLAGARKHALDDGDTIRAFLEDVWCSPQMGVKSAFTFGQEVGRIKMALRGTGIPYDLVAPIRWQNALDCRTFGDKNVTHQAAARHFPMVKVTHAIADALLIARYGVAVLEGEFVAPPRRSEQRRPKVRRVRLRA